MPRLDRQRMVIAGQRFLVASQRPQQIAAIHMRGDMAGIGRRSAPHPFHRFRQILALRLQHAHRMQHFSSIGLPCQHCPVRRLCIVQFSLPMQIHAPLKLRL